MHLTATETNEAKNKNKRPPRCGDSKSKMKVILHVALFVVVCVYVSLFVVVFSHFLVCVCFALQPRFWAF